MSESLLTKYRPAEWDEVLGNEVVVRSLQDFVERKTTQAILLSGPSGVGKTTLARIAATKLGCAVDHIWEVDAAAHSKVEECRALIEAVSWPSLGGSPVRVVIIDECHALSKASWQSLLKSVEEPVPDLYWIFCTTDAHKVYDPIKTRCASFSLQGVPIPELEEFIRAVAQEEGDRPLEEFVRLVAKEARGSVRLALACYSVARTAKTYSEAEQALNVAVTADTVDIPRAARAMLKGLFDWQLCKKFVAEVRDVDAETVRIALLRYFKAVFEDAKTPESAEVVLFLMDNFSTPTYGEHASLYLALGRVVFNEGE